MAEKTDRSDPMARRDALLAEINTARDEVLKTELEPAPVAEEAVEAEAVETESAIPPEEGQESAPAEQAAEPEPTEPEPPAAPIETPADPMVEVVVDGARRMVHQSDIIEAGRRAYQMDSAAQNRLQEAAATLRQAQEYAQSLRTQPAPEPEPPAEESDEPYVELVKAIQFGDPADAGKTLKSFIKSRQSGSHAGDPAQIAERVVRQALDEREWNDARATFDKEYQDIKADPDIAQIAGPYLITQVTLALQAARQQGGQRPPYLAILRDAGNRVRAKFVGGSDSGQTKATPTGPTVSVDPNRTAMKRTMPQPPAARGTQRPLGESVQLDPEKVITAARQKSINEIIASRSHRIE